MDVKTRFSLELMYMCPSIVPVSQESKEIFLNSYIS